jgi:hypothetical protein
MESPKTAILADDSCNTLTREQEAVMINHRSSAFAGPLPSSNLTIGIFQNGRTR